MQNIYTLARIAYTQAVCVYNGAMNNKYTLLIHIYINGMIETEREKDREREREKRQDR